MCREVVAVLKRLKQSRDMSLNEVGTESAFFCWRLGRAGRGMPECPRQPGRHGYCGAALLYGPAAWAPPGAFVWRAERELRIPMHWPSARVPSAPHFGPPPPTHSICCFAWLHPQVRLTVAIEDPRARERRLMGMEVRGG